MPRHHQHHTSEWIAKTTSNRLPLDFHESSTNPPRGLQETSTRPRRYIQIDLQEASKTTSKRIPAASGSASASASQWSKLPALAPGFHRRYLQVLMLTLIQKYSSIDTWIFNFAYNSLLKSTMPNSIDLEERSKSQHQRQHHHHHHHHHRGEDRVTTSSKTTSQITSISRP